jgi:hypothetical protein
MADLVVGLAERDQRQHLAPAVGQRKGAAQDGGVGSVGPQLAQEQSALTGLARARLPLVLLLGRH